MLSNWQTLYLYQLCHINLPSREVVNLDKDLITYNIIDNDCIDDKLSKIIKTKKLKELNFNKAKFKIALKGDFIICLEQNFIKGELKAAFVEEDILVTENFAVLTPKVNMNLDFLMWAFKQEYVISQIKPLNLGRKYFNVTGKELSKILIPVDKYNGNH